MPATIRVLICDDHPIVREALRSRLEGLDAIEVAGEAASGLEAIESVRSLAPDLVVVDIEMPGLDGISATRRITKAWPEVRVLMFTAHEEPDLAAFAADAGASGYLLKSASAAETRHAVLAVGGGRTWFPGGPGSSDRAEAGDDLSRLRRLTSRERQILDLLAEGLRADGIALEIGISRATVYTHIRNAVAKLGVDTHTEAVAFATRYAFIAPEG